MELWFFDIPNEHYEYHIDRGLYDSMSDEEADKSGLPLTGPYVRYEDFLKLEKKFKEVTTNGY